MSDIAAKSADQSVEPKRDDSVNSLIPVLRGKVEKLLILAYEANLNVGTFECVRSAERQEWLHKRAKEMQWEAIPDGKVERSVHQEGRAVDIVFKDLEGKWSWSESHDWNALGELGERLGLVWGGHWEKPDPAHFELGDLNEGTFEIETLETPSNTSSLGCGGACGKCSKSV